jgi:hypothetical protein
MDATLNRVINTAKYNAFYNLIAIALETGNQERAGDHMRDAYLELGVSDSTRLERELTQDYYAFT